MKRSLMLFAAVVACLGLGVVTASGANSAKVKKFSSNVTIKFVAGTPPYHGDAFNGAVTSKKNKCIKKRRIVITNKNTGNSVSAVKTNGKGKWKAQLNGTIPKGKYQAKAKKKTLNNGKIVCKKGKSPVINVPAH
jgi:hypothetical protein